MHSHWFPYCCAHWVCDRFPFWNLIKVPLCLSIAIVFCFIVQLSLYLFSSYFLPIIDLFICVVIRLFCSFTIYEIEEIPQKCFFMLFSIVDILNFLSKGSVIRFFIIAFSLFAHFKQGGSLAHRICLDQSLFFILLCSLLPVTPFITTFQSVSCIFEDDFHSVDVFNLEGFICDE